MSIILFFFINSEYSSHPNKSLMEMLTGCQNKKLFVLFPHKRWWGYILDRWSICLTHTHTCDAGLLDCGETRTPGPAPHRTASRLSRDLFTILIILNYSWIMQVFFTFLVTLFSKQVLQSLEKMNVPFYLNVEFSWNNKKTLYKNIEIDFYWNNRYHNYLSYNWEF